MYDGTVTIHKSNYKIQLQVQCLCLLANVSSCLSSWAQCRLSIAGRCNRFTAPLNMIFTASTMCCQDCISRQSGISRLVWYAADSSISHTEAAVQRSPALASVCAIALKVLLAFVHICVFFSLFCTTCTIL